MITTKRQLIQALGRLGRANTIITPEYHKGDEAEKAL